MFIKRFIFAGVMALGLIGVGTAGATTPAVQYKVSVQNTAVGFQKVGIGHFGEKTYQYQLGFINTHVFGWYWVWTNTTLSSKILNRDYATYLAYAKKGKIIEKNPPTSTSHGFRILALLPHDCFEAIQSYKGSKGYIVEIHDEQARCSDVTPVVNPVVVAVRNRVFGTTLPTPVVTPVSTNPLHTQYAFWNDQMYTIGNVCFDHFRSENYGPTLSDLEKVVQDCTNAGNSAAPPSALLNDPKVVTAYQDYQTAAEAQVHYAQCTIDSQVICEDAYNSASQDYQTWVGDIQALDSVYGKP